MMCLDYKGQPSIDGVVKSLISGVAPQGHFLRGIVFDSPSTYYMYSRETVKNTTPRSLPQVAYLYIKLFDLAIWNFELAF